MRRCVRWQRGYAKMECVSVRTEFWETALTAAASIIDTLASLISILVPILIIVLASLAGRISALERFFVLASLRRAAHLERRRLGHGNRAQVRSVSRALSAHIVLRLADAPVTVAEAIDTRILRDRTRSAARADLLLARRLALMAGAPGRQSAIARLAWPESMDRAREVHVQFAEYISRTYADKASLRSRPERREFADLVSLYSGALVFADGQQARSGVIADVQIIARHAWDGPEHPHPSAVGILDEDPETQRAGRRARTPTPYDARHEGVDVTRLRAPRGKSIPSGLGPGDYDGRIFSLRRVDTLVDRGDGSLTIALETHDSCYTVSERAPGLRCKHLSTDLRTPESGAAALPETPGFAWDPESGSFSRECEQVVLLNTVLGVIAHDEQGPALLLARRTNRANNAHDVLSATSGGVFENRRSVGVNDADALGTPSPLVSTVREAEEELGLHLDPARVAAQAVFLSNVQGRPKGQSRENGQLVASVCYLTEVGATSEEIDRSRALNAHWESGRYEASDLVPLPFPVPVDRTPIRRTESARDFLQTLHTLGRELDQNAVICALYGAAHQYGKDAVLGALREHEDEPWWTQPWSDDAGAVRAARHPRVLFGALETQIFAAHQKWADKGSETIPLEDARGQGASADSNA